MSKKLRITSWDVASQKAWLGRRLLGYNLKKASYLPTNWQHLLFLIHCFYWQGRRKGTSCLDAILLKYRWHQQLDNNCFLLAEKESHAWMPSCGSGCHHLFNNRRFSISRAAEKESHVRKPSCWSRWHQLFIISLFSFGRDAEKETLECHLAGVGGIICLIIVVFFWWSCRKRKFWMPYAGVVGIVCLIIDVFPFPGLQKKKAMHGRHLAGVSGISCLIIDVFHFQGCRKRKPCLDAILREKIVPISCLISNNICFPFPGQQKKKAMLGRHLAGVGGISCL